MMPSPHNSVRIVAALVVVAVGINPIGSPAFALRPGQASQGREAAALKAGLEELPGTIEETVQRYFGRQGPRKSAGSQREDEIALERFLAESRADEIRRAAAQLAQATSQSKRQRAERAVREAVARQEALIHRFIRLIEADRRQAGLLVPGESLGPYQLPPIAARELPAPGQRSGAGALAIEIPSDRASYELERLHVMAQTAIQRALGREIVVNIGIGFVGTAVSTATAAEGKRDFGTRDPTRVARLQYRPPLEGVHDAYFTLASQRPSPASAYKVPAMNRGQSPIQTRDPEVASKIKHARAAGTLQATYLAGVIAVADIVMLETELHVAKVLPTHLEHARIEDRSSVELVRQVGRLMRPGALVIVESTIAPGLTRHVLLPALDDELRKRRLLATGARANLAHSFQRLEPGARWYRSLLEQVRVGAGVTPEATRLLTRYFQTVGFTYEISPSVEAVEFMKCLENAWRFGMLELMNAYMQAAEIVGVDGYAVATKIARARPDTHGLIQLIAGIQVGGYCIPKEMVQIVKALADYYGVSLPTLTEIFRTRFVAAMASDFRGWLAALRAAEALRASGRRLDDARVHVLGVAYGPGVGDTRMSGVERAVREFARLGVRPSSITVTDPHAKTWPELQQQQLASPECWGYGLRNQHGLADVTVETTDDPYPTMVPDQDVLLLATPHPSYQGLDPVKVAARFMGRGGRVVIDTANFLSDEDYQVFLALGWRVVAYGKGHLGQLEQALTRQQRLEAVEALLRELASFEGYPGVNHEELNLALAAARAKHSALKARTHGDAAVAEARAQRAAARQERFYADRALSQTLTRYDDDDERVERLRESVALAEARAAWAEARANEVLQGRRGASARALRGLREDVKRTQARVTRLMRRQQRDVTGYIEEQLVRPAMRRAAGMIKKTAFWHGVPARYLMMQRPLTGPAAARVDRAVHGGDWRLGFLALADELDQALHRWDYLSAEVFTPEEVRAQLLAIRHAEERLHPERTLRPERRTIPYTVYRDGGEVVQQATVEVDLVQPIRYHTDLETGTLEIDRDVAHETNIVLKQLPDLLQSNVPGHWGRYFVLVRPRLVPITDAALRAYPPAFDDLPPELAGWLVREVYGQGYTLTTLDSKGALEQDKVLLLMVVDPFGAGSGRAGYLVWADSLQPVVCVTPDGYEVPVSIKGVGLFVGGDRRFPHTTVETLGATTGRAVAGGMTEDGSVGQSRISQVPGEVLGVGSEHGLTLLSTTDASHDGLAQRLVFGTNYTFARARKKQRREYFTSARQEFDTARLGWRFRGRPFDGEAEAVRSAGILGWNAAELLAHLPFACVHIALTLDNVQANGYLTDPDSIVPPLYRERDPRGAFFKYFGFAMQQCVMGWEQMKASKEGVPYDIEDRHLQLLRPWLRGFMGHFLASGRVPRATFEKFNVLSKLPEEAFIPALRQSYQTRTNRETFEALALDLINTIWREYLAYEVVRDRVKYGYSHTVESTYTSTAHETLAPDSAEAARSYLQRHRETLRACERLVRSGTYPSLAFDFDRAFRELSDHEARLEALTAQGRKDFSEVYPLSFYGEEARPVVAVLDLDDVAVGRRPLHLSGEIPVGAPLVEKEVVTQPARAAGLEEPQPHDTMVSQGQRAIADHQEAAPLWTLGQWQGLLAGEIPARLMDVLTGRYGDDPAVLDDRVRAYRTLVRGAVTAGFALDQPVVIVAAPGRDRLFSGHVDFTGLGGPTVNATTQEELLAVVQATGDGIIHLSNADPAFGPAEFSVAGVHAVASDPANLGKEVWDPRQWDSYVRGALAYLLSDHSAVSDVVRAQLGSAGIRMHVASVGTLALPYSGGLSSSSALTGALCVGLNAIFHLGLSDEQLAETDFGERYLGVDSGPADKTAQLRARRGEVVVVGSLPETFRGTVKFPKGLTVLMVDGTPPRLMTSEGHAWLREHHPADARDIMAWADAIMYRFSYRAYVNAVQRLRQALRDPEQHQAAGVTVDEAAAVERALMAHPKGHPAGLLRELTNGGAVEETLPAVAGWDRRHARYDLIYCLLKLIPEEQRVTDERGRTHVLPLRKAALYGLAETERTAAYLRELQAAVEAEGRGDDEGRRAHIARILDLVRWAHDGDRATTDYRAQFMETPWAHDPRNDVSDAAIDQWRQALARDPESQELPRKPGGFERSIPDFDEVATEADARFEGQVAMRVAAAGLGGTIAIHALDEAAPALTTWLEAKGWKVRRVQPGAPIQMIAPSLDDVLAAKRQLDAATPQLRATDGRYGMVFSDPVGLAAGSVWAQAKRGDGTTPLARRFVATEPQREILLSLGVLGLEIVTIETTVDEAVRIAGAQLKAIPGVDQILPINGLAIGELSKELNRLALLLGPPEYDAELVHRAAARVYDLFV